MPSIRASKAAGSSLVTEPGVSSAGGDELQDETGEGFGQVDGLVAEEQPDRLAVGGDVVGGELADGCGPLGVEQDEQAGPGPRV
ncbi:MAG TPA: hypothetical protein VGR06_15245 [Actinophytocola sp.]|uniref:hypothetical protein n=1 Tax=Actinophytocola sp. TaxID=1872138 RepID=UPI002DF87456|nr:hypothetical protein [Actinophytocola sp.]